MKKKLNIYIIPKEKRREINNVIANKEDHTVTFDNVGVIGTIFSCYCLYFFFYLASCDMSHVLCTESTFIWCNVRIPRFLYFKPRTIYLLTINKIQS